MSAKIAPPSSATIDPFPTFSDADLAAERPLRWLVPGILPEGPSVTAIFGPSGSGKSFLALDIAAAISLGHPWFGRLCRQAPVLYACLEGQSGLASRVYALQEKLGKQGTEIAFLHRTPFDLLRDWQRLAVTVPRGGVLFIDTLAAATPTVDENSSEMKLVAAAAQRVAVTASCCVVLIHHTGKDREKGLRGHSSLKGALDAALEVGKGKEGARWWQLEKGKESEDGEKCAFRLTTVSWEKWLEDETVSCSSCYVEEGEGEQPQPADKWKSRTLALEVLRELNEGEEVVSEEDWKGAFCERTEGKANARRMAFQRARDALVKTGDAIKVANGVYKVHG